MDTICKKKKILKSLTDEFTEEVIFLNNLLTRSISCVTGFWFKYQNYSTFTKLSTFL